MRGRAGENGGSCDGESCGCGGACCGWPGAPWECWPQTASRTGCRAAFCGWWRHAARRSAATTPVRAGTAPCRRGEWPVYRPRWSTFAVSTRAGTAGRPWAARGSLPPPHGTPQPPAVLCVPTTGPGGHPLECGVLFAHAARVWCTACRLWFSFPGHRNCIRHFTGAIVAQQNIGPPVGIEPTTFRIWSPVRYQLRQGSIG